MNEQQAAAKWLYATLAAAAGVTALVSTRIYEDEAPEGGAVPAVIFAQVGGQLTHAAGQDRRILTRLFFSIRGVCDGASYAPADAIADALDLALSGQSGTVTVGAQAFTILGCWQDNPLRYPETIDGQPHRHAGGVYAVDLHATP